ncbi:MAG: alkaline phosphatase family protein [Planctomycetes bacterium]|nr:alkaline phosphatase family protein [Planctomycetota bacterium]MBL7009031.1 alkaline phosphatase family protein [Planctomycetota bacterium]
MSRFHRLRLPLAALAAWWIAPEPAMAYIGPGAGFAFLGGGLVILSSLLLAVGVLLAFPVKLLFRQVTGAGRIKGDTKRLVIVGLDGLDPQLAGRWMAEGKLPNLKRLADEGTFKPLATSYPSMSPVAWSSFTTGVDPSRHNIFDFITRDPCTYLPILSSTDIRSSEKTLSLGKYRIPLGKPSIRLLRRGKPWWKILGERKIFSNIIRVPITFPPEEFHGVCLSGMCVPDLKGTQGSFSFWTDDSSLAGPEAGGEVNLVGRNGDTLRCAVSGPANPMVEGNPVMRIPMRVDVLEENERVKVTIGAKGDEQHEFELKVREYSDWLTFEFSAAPVIGKVTGIARLYVMGTEPFGLYMTPLQIDPANPAMPISHPKVYSIYLAKKHGPYSTLGLAEDTWALNERVIDERAFFEQACLIFEEREKMLFDALEKTPTGSVVCVFDGTDRVSHMFYRYFEADHPANAGKDTEWGRDKILEIYQKADTMIGRVRQELKPKRDRLMVISDHGFCSFQRGVNLNAWLRDEGYLVLKPDAPVDAASGKQTSRDWLQDVDWSRTKAFSLGLTGMFINRKARERDGIVEEGAELQALKAEIVAKLSRLIDPKTGEPVFREVFDAEKIFTGPYVFEAPDLFMGYRRGYRNSWDCATGSAPPEVFSDNAKSWSGDHCIDPREVPGVFFCDQPINTDEPTIMDIAPTALRLFEVGIPKYMQGQALFGPRTGPSTPSPAFETAEPETVQS